MSIDKPPRRDQSCQNCSGWRPNRQANPKSGAPRQGWCVAMPPGIIQVMVKGFDGQPVAGTQGAWPTSNSDQWCRGWELSEDDGNGRQS